MSVDTAPFVAMPPSSPRPSRITAILTHKFRLSSDAGRNLGLAEVRERMLREELELEQPSVPEEGATISALAEAEGILRDTHGRYLLCAESVKDALTQARNIDATTADPVVRRETRANLMELREKLAALKLERSLAEEALRRLPDFADHRSVIAMLLEAERDTQTASEKLEELRAEHSLAVDTLRYYGEHTQLSLSKRIPAPVDPAPDDGRRCVMCNDGFPAIEVETAPCGHFYHIFCLAIRVAMYPECCHDSCRLPFPVLWMRSYGFPNVALSDSDSDSIHGGTSSGGSSGSGSLYFCSTLASFNLDYVFCINLVASESF